MNYKLVARTLGALLIFFTLSTGLSFAWSYFLGEEQMIQAFLYTAIFGLGLGMVFMILGRRAPEQFFLKEGIAIVSLSWILCAVIAALPFYFSGEFISFVDSFFESMSGLTTTGATVISHIDHLPRGLLFWRSFIQWLGGMGIIVLFVAVLPALGVGGKFLYRSEVPGISKEGLRPQIRQTASILWRIYIGLTLAEVLALKLCGLSLFDALCHTFTTVATGGFSTYNDSIAHFNSLAVELVIMIFMFLAGVNFTLHFLFLRGPRKKAFQDPELRNYLFITLGAILVLTFYLIVQYDPASFSLVSWGRSLRKASFQAISILTTTGFSTTDFNLWPSVCKMILIALMFCGGCAGSTGGGMKVYRLVVTFKSIYLGILQFIRPRMVKGVRMGNEMVSDEIHAAISRFVITFVSIFFLCSLFMASLGLDPITAFSSVIASMGNIGPGLGGVGPTQTFAFLPPSGKYVLAFCMMLGRLELYTAIALFIPFFWKRG